MCGSMLVCCVISVYVVFWGKGLTCKKGELRKKISQVMQMEKEVEGEEIWEKGKKGRRRKKGTRLKKREPCGKETSGGEKKKALSLPSL